MIYKNPVNDHTEKVCGSFSCLWVFLFGPIYWAFKGVWRHAVLHFLLVSIAIPYSVILALFLLHFFLALGFGLAPRILVVIILFSPIMTHLIYPLFTYRILEKHYNRIGWVRVEEEKK